MGLLDFDNPPPQIQPGAPTFAQISTGPQPGAPAPMAGPGPAQMPSQPTPSLWDRLKTAAQHISGGINSTPQAYLDSGLITDADLKHARSRGLLDLGLGILSSPTMGTFGQALAHGVQGIREGFNQDIQEPIQQGQQAIGLNYQQGILRARAQLGQYYAPQPGDTPQSLLIKKQAYAQHLASIGDMEGAKEVGGGLDSVYGNESRPMEIDWKDSGTQLLPVNKLTGQPIPWLSPIQKTGTPMSADAKAFKESQQALAQGNASANREDRLVSQYDNDTKGYKTAADQIDQAYSVLPSAKSGNAAAQQSLMYNVMNLEHPGESVPRNQVTQYAQSLGPAEQIRLFGSKLTKGQAALTQDQVSQLENVLREAHGRVASQMAPIMSTYGSRAKAQGVDPSVFIDPTELLAKKWGDPNGTGAPGANKVRSLLSQ